MCCRHIPTFPRYVRPRALAERLLTSPFTPCPLDVLSRWHRAPRTYGVAPSVLDEPVAGLVRPQRVALVRQAGGMRLGQDDACPLPARQWPSPEWQWCWLVGLAFRSQQQIQPLEPASGSSKGVSAFTHGPGTIRRPNREATRVGPSPLACRCPTAFGSAPIPTFSWQGLPSPLRVVRLTEGSRPHGPTRLRPREGRRRIVRPTRYSL